MAAFEQLARALRLLREHRGLTQRELADAIESPLKQINAYENGRQRPRIETLERILAAVGADAMVLADTMAGLAETGEAEAPGSAAEGASAAAATPPPAVELSPELRELAPRLPQIEALANEVLLELLSEAVERQARWLSDDLRAGRPAVELPRRERDDG